MEETRRDINLLYEAAQAISSFRSAVLFQNDDTEQAKVGSGFLVSGFIFRFSGVGFRASVRDFGFRLQGVSGFDC